MTEPNKYSSERVVPKKVTRYEKKLYRSCRHFLLLPFSFFLNTFGLQPHFYLLPFTSLLFPSFELPTYNFQLTKSTRKDSCGSGNSTTSDFRLRSSDFGLPTSDSNRTFTFYLAPSKSYTQPRAHQAMLLHY